MAFKTIMNFVMTDECYDMYFVDFNFLDVPCFSAVLSKCLGYALIAGAVLVKIPQIQKIVAAKSAFGVSFLSLLLEIYAVTSMLSYSYAKEFPFSSWGDSFFLMLQNVILGCLIQHYSGNTGLGVLFVIVFGAILFVLTSGMTSIAALAALQASNMPAIIVSKLMQAFGNFKNGHTGQLSAITVFLIFAGSVTRIFTSIQETGDQLIILNYVVSSVCNAVLAFQMVWYWNVGVKAKKE